MKRQRFWTCRGCATRHPRVKRKCAYCGRARPARRRPKHMAALDEPYDRWVERYGELCGICGRPPTATRRLDRDHDHRTGKPRGLLCVRCNRALANWVSVDWLRSAAAYLERS